MKMQFIYHQGAEFLNNNNSFAFSCKKIIMMPKLLKSRLFEVSAQSILEYALIIAVASAALIAMQIYLKRGFQGRLRLAADEMGGQYSPQNTTSEIITALDMEQNTNQTLVPVKHADGSDVIDQNTLLPVYGTEVNTTFKETSTKASGSYEHVGPFEANLFD